MMSAPETIAGSGDTDEAGSRLIGSASPSSSVGDALSSQVEADEKEDSESGKRRRCPVPSFDLVCCCLFPPLNFLFALLRSAMSAARWSARHGTLLCTVGAVLCVLLLAWLEVAYLPDPLLAGEGDRTLVYPLQHSPCVSIVTSRYGVIGCHTSRNGVEGYLHYVGSNVELDEFIGENTGGDGKPFEGLWLEYILPGDRIALLLNASLLSRENIERLHARVPLVSMVVVLSPYTSADPLYGSVGYQQRFVDFDNFSPDTQHPNREYGLYPESEHKWNPDGTGWLWRDIPLPVTPLPFDESERLLAIVRGQTNAAGDLLPTNRSGVDEDGTRASQYGLRFVDFMHSSPDATPEDCLMKKECMPVGGYSVYASLGHLTLSGDLVLTMASIDAKALFHSRAVGASKISGAIALLAAIEVLSAIPIESFKRMPMFMFFTAEQWGYSGSKRFVRDLQQYACLHKWGAYCHNPYRSSLDFQTYNLKLSRFSHAIEVGEIGSIKSGRSLFAHTLNLQPNVQEILDSFNAGVSHSRREERETESKRNGTSSTDAEPEVKHVNHRRDGNSENESETAELPPSSLHSFFRADPNFPAVLLTDYQSNFRTRYSGSVYDDYDQFDITAICTTATLIARSVWRLAKEDDVDDSRFNFYADCNTIFNWLDCLTITRDCQIMRDLKLFQYLSAPVTNYAGVFIPGRGRNVLESLLYFWLGNITATNTYPDSLCSRDNDCQSFHRGHCIGGICVSSPRSLVHDAFSPAFEYNADEREWTIVDETEPMMLEPFWTPITLHLYQRSSLEWDRVVLCVGFTFTVVCVLIAHCTFRKSLL